MTIISKPLYVYLQRPDNGEWVTAGRYTINQRGEGVFHSGRCAGPGLAPTAAPAHGTQCGAAALR